MREEILRLDHVTYRFNGADVLDNFSMEMWRGEILGLIQIDEIGISALLELLQYNHRLYYGYVYMHEKPVNTWEHPGKGMNRVSIIRTRSALADKLTVADNIFVLRHGFRKYLINSRILALQLKPFMDDIGVEIPADSYIEELSVYERFIVEILKAVVSGSWIIIIEDPGTLVSSTELESLHRILRHYASQGFSIIYSSVHSERTVQLCDRLSYMEGGQIIKTFRTGDRLPAGKNFIHGEKSYGRISDRKVTGEKVLEINGLTCFGLNSACFCVHKGECAAITETDPGTVEILVELITGKRKNDLEGCALINGHPAYMCDERDIAVIPMNPEEKLLFNEMSYMDNLMFCMDHRLKNVWRNRKISESLKNELASELGGKDIFDMSVGALDDLQKTDLVYARIRLQRPSLVCCIQPFREAGIAKRMHIASLIRRFADRGTAVLIVSAGMNDALLAADRILHIDENGRISETL